MTGHKGKPEVIESRNGKYMVGDSYRVLETNIGENGVGYKLLIRTIGILEHGMSGRFSYELGSPSYSSMR